MPSESRSREALEYLERNGCSARLVPISRLEDIKDEIRLLHAEGKLEDEFFHEWLQSRLEPKAVRRMENAKSILIASVPTPALVARFHWNGQVLDLTIPPTYAEYRRVSDLAMRLLREALRPEKHWVARAVMPVKLLAVRTGLACYGRNNITYIPEYGSFHTLVALFTDLESPTDVWKEKAALARCSTCKACVTACPTGAICVDRFLIHADKCLVRFNERRASKPFPDWIDPSAHNALIGCMRCQKVCPYNRRVVNWRELREEFSEEDTAFLLKGGFSGPRTRALDKRLKKIGLELAVFPRNFEVLLRQRGVPG